VLYRMVLNSVYRIRCNLKIRYTETSIEDALPNPPPLHLQCTLSTFAKSFSTSSLHCCSVVGQQFRTNYEIDNVVFLQDGFCVLENLFFTDESWFPLSGYVNSYNGRIWSAKNLHAQH
jgi:hypothetical protein